MNVSVVKCNDYSSKRLKDSINRAIDLLGGIGKFIKRGERVLLKPNLLYPAARESAVVTDPAFVCAVAELVLDAGAKPFVADSPAFGSARQVARKVGLLELVEKLGVEVQEFNSPVRISLKDGSHSGSVVVDRRVLEADRVINLPKLKTHQQLVFTGAIKNTFGCMNGKRKALMHLIYGGNELSFGRLLLDIYKVVKPALNIVDSIIAMEGSGPRKGVPKKLGYIVAGDNGLAVDRVIMKIIGVKRSPPYINAADKAGLKPKDIRDVKILGDSIEELIVNDFKFPVFFPIGFSPIRILKSTMKDILTRFGIQAVE